jgi:hypothetical protein
MTASLDVLSKYQTICCMIGDSLVVTSTVHGATTVHMLNPNTTVLYLNITEETKEKVEFQTKVKNMIIIYTPFGAIFLRPSLSQPMYKNKYPSANTTNGTANDLIVINAARHYSKVNKPFICKKTSQA